MTVIVLIGCCYFDTLWDKLEGFLKNGELLVWEAAKVLLCEYLEVAAWLRADINEWLRSTEPSTDAPGSVTSSIVFNWISNNVLFEN